MSLLQARKIILGMGGWGVVEEGGVCRLTVDLVEISASVAGGGR